MVYLEMRKRFKLLRAQCLEKVNECRYVKLYLLNSSLLWIDRADSSLDSEGGRGPLGELMPDSSALLEGIVGRILEVCVLLFLDSYMSFVERTR